MKRDINYNNHFIIAIKMKILNNEITVVIQLYVKITD